MMEAAVDALTRVLVTYAESPRNPSSFADAESSDNSSAANPDDAETVAPAPWLDITPCICLSICAWR